MESKVISRKKSKGKKGFTPSWAVEFEPEDFFLVGRDGEVDGVQQPGCADEGVYRG